ncbi:hypothetical protein ACA910_018104 [Epithemia clementina (nom. ined.)]
MAEGLVRNLHLAGAKKAFLLCFLIIWQSNEVGGFVFFHHNIKQSKYSQMNDEDNGRFTLPLSTPRSLASSATPGDGDSFSREEEEEEEEESLPASRLVIGVTLKIAVDANGGVAELDSQESERFTSPASLDMVHRLRRESDAVLVGRGTVQADNPSLIVRRVPPRTTIENNNCDHDSHDHDDDNSTHALNGGNGRRTPIQPLRVVLDPTLSLPMEQFANEKTYQIFDDGYRTVVYHTLPDFDHDALAVFDSVDFVQLPAISRKYNGKILRPESPPKELKSGGDSDAPSTSQNDQKVLSVASIMSDLSQRYRVKHLMVEGGPLTAQSFLRARLVDRVIVVKSPICFRRPLQSGISSSLLQDAGLVLLGTYQLDSDDIECWSRPHLEWPSDNIQDWP